MFDRSITIESLAAWALWTLGAALTFGDWLGFTSDGSGFPGVALVALGHLACTHNTLSGMREREQAAFDLGRDAVARLPRR